MSRKKCVIVICAPSGSGKTTIVKHLLKKHPTIFSFSISATTRKKREQEIEGEDYYFMSHQSFQEKILQKEFVEWEMVYPTIYYGTLWSELDRIWKDNKKPLLDIDVMGALALKDIIPSDQYISIFISPPSSIDILRERLVLRNQDSEESIDTRMRKAKHELLFKHQFKHVVLNDSLPHAIEKVESIIFSLIQ